MMFGEDEIETPIFLLDADARQRLEKVRAATIPSISDINPALASKSLTKEQFPSVAEKNLRVPALYEVIRQHEYKSSDKAKEENTFTNIDFSSRNWVPETLEEAEHLYMYRASQAKPASSYTSSEVEPTYKSAVDDERRQFRDAVEKAFMDRPGKGERNWVSLMPGEAKPAVISGIAAEVLPPNVVLKKKAKDPSSASSASASATATPSSKEKAPKTPTSSKQKPTADGNKEKEASPVPGVGPATATAAATATGVKKIGRAHV
eukprot:TRINITY_DN7509_c0_g1_i1.p2 TRINITY_DN7509_c0_g1~~TRINITY_DN7509_c0_g1_i1.p2  ORF type:complete len:263 (-),score=71.23 TRINITY_DN7509_c0_g1_i1:24-812(-)